MESPHWEMYFFTFFIYFISKWLKYTTHTPVSHSYIRRTPKIGPQKLSFLCAPVASTMQVSAPICSAIHARKLKYNRYSNLMEWDFLCSNTYLIVQRSSPTMLIFSAANPRAFIRAVTRFKKSLSHDHIWSHKTKEEQNLPDMHR